ncbi:hypothetical protein KC222_04360 [Cedecea davisae]|uniref:Ead/Ea22-like family protein n=1 Tax=Cedecea davisae TaxID=158484 RepID=A0ABS6DDI7_9ENTR|nr:hypothetical protein [Cedecea davisae]MBU4681242.1 hypothetical protein [Cedecea davisae]MBU4686320.1 hypothetical protein [Cedecea davisae]
MTKQLEALIARKGNAVTGNYYLAECGFCGEMFSSGLMTGGEPLYAGDYADSYCPHCGAADCDISDYGDINSDAAMAWNHQQKHIDQLIVALEQAQQYAKQRDEENQDLMLTIGRLRVEREHLEASPLAVKLPPEINPGQARSLFSIEIDEDQAGAAADGWNSCLKAIRAAGGTVSEGE